MESMREERGCDGLLSVLFTYSVLKSDGVMYCEGADVNVTFICGVDCEEREG